MGHFGALGEAVAFYSDARSVVDAAWRLITDRSREYIIIEVPTPSSGIWRASCGACTWEQVAGGQSYIERETTQRDRVLEALDEQPVVPTEIRPCVVGGFAFPPPDHTQLYTMDVDGSGREIKGQSTELIQALEDLAPQRSEVSTLDFGTDEYSEHSAASPSVYERFTSHCTLAGSVQKSPAKKLAALSWMANCGLHRRAKPSAGPVIKKRRATVPAGTPQPQARALQRSGGSAGACSPQLPAYRRLSARPGFGAALILGFLLIVPLTGLSGITGNEGHMMLAVSPPIQLRLGYSERLDEALKAYHDAKESEANAWYSPTLQRIMRRRNA